MQPFTLSHRPEIIFGAGRLAGLASKAEHLAGKGAAVLVVADPTLTTLGITGRALEQRVVGSAAAAMLAAQNGARIIRVHDVAETKDALAMLAAVNGAKRNMTSAPAKPSIQWPDED